MGTRLSNRHIANVPSVKARSTCPSKTVRWTCVNRMRLSPPPHMYAFIPRRESISRRTAEMETPEDQEMLVTIGIAYYYIKRVKKWKNRHIWVHPINLRRREQGAYHNLVRQLYNDAERFVQYFRLNRERFSQVLHFIGDVLRPGLWRPLIREVICPKERLAICLR